MTDINKSDKVKKKVDLGTIAFAKVNKLEKRVLELENIVKRIPPTQTLRNNGGTV